MNIATIEVLIDLNDKELKKMMVNDLLDYINKDFPIDQLYHEADWIVQSIKEWAEL